MSKDRDTREISRSLEDVLVQVRELVDEVRVAGLWYVSDDFRPDNREQALRALRWIERSGNRETYIEARRLREWLSPTSNVASAESSPTVESSRERVTSPGR